MAQQLKGKTAVIYGAGGAIGSAVARAFAAEGASVHVTGHAMAAVQEIAEEIEAAGHEASAAAVDALDEAAIEQHLDQLTRNGAAIDISFNAVGFKEVQGVPLVGLALKDFLDAITNWSQTVFLTSRAAARRMTQQGSGVILTVQPPAAGTPLASGFGAAVAALESVALTLAAEVGQEGVRVMILQPNALPQSETLQESFRKYASGLGITKEAALADFASTTMLKRLPTLEEFSDVAAFVASDRASALTGSIIKIDCGM
jgi:NAD(P)-dependent dehydrogenase (short-subunit alcohol dehydrogenase family)